jgi:hypothetical protein
MSSGCKPAEHLMEVDFRTARTRVASIQPVEDENVERHRTRREGCSLNPNVQGGVTATITHHHGVIQ